jgi:dienelactone hydrolase
MVGIFRELSRQYKLQRKFFVTGFSAGAQFSHRFALACPQYVVGCAAHSAGSWGSPNSKARYVPFVVTCGEDDEQRIHMARNFADDLKRKGYKVTAAWFDGVGHSMCQQARELTTDLYWACTTGMTVEERQKALKALEEGEELFEGGKFAEAYRALIRLAKAKRKTEFSERAASTLRQIAKLGAEKLAEIQEQAKTDADGAVAALERLQNDFRGFRVARAAGQLLAKLKSGEAAAPSAPEPTVAEKPDDKPSPAKPQPKPRPAAGQAERWLRMARNYIANGKKDMARRYLELILTRCPDSDEAEDAKLLLMDL